MYHVSSLYVKSPEPHILFSTILCAKLGLRAIYSLRVHTPQVGLSVQCSSHTRTHAHIHTHTPARTHTHTRAQLPLVGGHVETPGETITMCVEERLRRRLHTLSWHIGSHVHHKVPETAHVRYKPATKRNKLNHPKLPYRCMRLCQKKKPSHSFVTWTKNYEIMYGFDPGRVSTHG